MQCGLGSIPCVLRLLLVFLVTRYFFPGGGGGRHWQGCFRGLYRLGCSFATIAIWFDNGLNLLRLIWLMYCMSSLLDWQIIHSLPYNITCTAERITKMDKLITLLPIGYFATAAPIAGTETVAIVSPRRIVVRIIRLSFLIFFFWWFRVKAVFTE